MHTTASRPVVSARALTRRYGPGPAALDAVDLAMAAGTFTAVMGASGSGKSTLLHLLAGLDAPDAGEVLLLGSALTGLDDDAAADVRHARMGFVFQSFNLVPGLSALENIRLPARLGRRSRTIDTAWEQHLVTVLGLRELLQRSPVELSGGQQQRVAIARALAHRPAVVFADEPTGSLDVATGRDVLTLFTQLARQAGTCVLMVTHDPVAAAAADRVIVLRDGRVIHDGVSGSPNALSRLMLDGVSR